MSTQSSIQQYDKKKIIAEITDLIQERNDWNGFRTRKEIKERFEQGGVSWVHNGGQIVCTATYNHRQRSHTRVYTTAMSDQNWRPDLWSQMVTGILLESPHDRLISKTPVDSGEVELWEDEAIRLREEDGLIIWERVDPESLNSLNEW